MMASLHEGNRQEAQRRAHTLKGLGGALGAQDLSRTAAALEDALLAGGDAVALAPLISALDGNLSHFLAAIDHALPQAAAEAVGAVGRDLDVASLACLLDQAIGRLEEFDSGVERIMALLHEAVGSDGEEGQALAALDQLVRAADYEAALERARRWRSSLPG